jgi:hypothetical protein
MSVDRFVIVETPSLTWPADLQIFSKYFRLFVAADSISASRDQIAAFVGDALMNGMVYCCSWGAGCERLHDIVDKVWVAGESGSQRLARPTTDDTVMTTWHEDETLEDALEFFVRSALPTPGYEAESNFWVVVAVANSNWTRVIREQLETLRSND